MRPFKHYFNIIVEFFRGSAPAPQRKTPSMLDKQILEQVFAEARFLQESYQVDVRELAAGEEAGPPRPAGDFDIPGFEPTDAAESSAKAQEQQAAPVTATQADSD